MKRVSCAALLVALGCGPRAGADAETAGGSTDASSTTASSVTDDGGSAETGANPCAALPWHGCLPIADCSVVDCGVAGAGYDEHGCLRAQCGDDEDCYEGEVCFLPVDWGGCVNSGTVCEIDDVTGSCECAITNDCGGSYCAIAGTVPTPECLQQTEEAPCYELGCNAFVSSQIVVLGPMGCECQAPVSICLYVPGEIGGEPAFTAYYREDGTGEVRLFPNGYTQDPIGWVRCADNPGEPASCGCSGCP